MKKIILIGLCICLVLLAGCKKEIEEDKPLSLNLTQNHTQLCRYCGYKNATDTNLDWISGQVECDNKHIIQFGNGRNRIDNGTDKWGEHQYYYVYYTELWCDIK